MSGPDGLFEISLEEPTYAAVSVAKPGFCELEDYLNVDDRGVVRRDYVLPRASASVQGMVVTSADEPIKGAMALVSFPRIFVPGQDIKGLSPQLAFTDSTGRFAIERLPSAEVQIVASARGYLISGSKTLTLTPGSRQTVRFVLKEARIVSLKIRDSQGLPLSSAYAELAQGLARSGPDGTIQLSIPKDRKTFSVTIRADGFLPQSVPVDVQNPATEVVLLPGTTVAGQVVGQQGPLRGAEIAVFVNNSGRDRWAKSATTDDAGRFSVRISARNASKIVASHLGYVQKTIPVDAATVESLFIELQPAEAGIFDRVLDDRQRPIKTFVVHLEGISEQDERFQLVRAFSDPDGFFSIMDLPAGLFNMRLVEPEQNRLKTINTLVLRKGLAYGEVQITLD